MHISKPAIGFRHIDLIRFLSGEKSRLRTSEHVAVHTIGAQHDILTQVCPTKVANIVIQVAFRIFNDPRG